MNHECLAALWYSRKGGCDHLLKLTKNPDFKEFVHPGEIEILRRILAIAAEYHKIERFIEITKFPSLRSVDESGAIQEQEKHEAPDEQPLKSGLYMMAFCSGLSTVLQEYKDEICQLEDTFLKRHQFSLVYILGTVEKYMVLFNTLNSVIKAIKAEGIYGCLLIGRMHNYIDCGITPLEKASRDVVWSVNKAFYNQLSNWLIFGNVNDAYGEFFICDCYCDDSDFLYDWETDKLSISSSHHNYNKSPILKTTHKVRKFVIRPNMLPPMMPIETADNILFIGRMVRILQNDPRRYESILTRVRNDIWAGRAVDCVKDIQSMENEPFNPSHFEKKIEHYRGKLTKYLWTVMIDEANLLQHLQMVRDYYCLGRGELFQQFIVAAEEQLPDIPVNYIIKNMNYIFGDTARQIYSSGDDTHTKFELVMPYNMTPAEYAQNPLGYVEMYFEIQWPLHVIFRPKVITLFNKVFTFLMRVKKTHIDLHQLWLKHMDVKNVDCSVWSLRHNLMFLVNNLQYYFQVDIIEAQFSILIEAIKNVNEYSDIVRMHSIFVSNLLSRTFVISLSQADKEQSQFNLLQLPNLDFEMRPKVYNIIICLLELCDSFCVLANNWHTELSAPERKQLDDIQINLDTILENLFRALQSMNEKVSGPHLLQLLHRLDFNRWFTKSKPDLNLSVA